MVGYVDGLYGFVVVVYVLALSLVPDGYIFVSNLQEHFLSISVVDMCYISYHLQVPHSSLDFTQTIIFDSI